MKLFVLTVYQLLTVQAFSNGLRIVHTHVLSHCLYLQYVVSFLYLMIFMTSVQYFHFLLPLSIFIIRVPANPVKFLYCTFMGVRKVPQKLKFGF